MRMSIVRNMCAKIYRGDMIGPPNPRSHLRPLRLAKPQFDTELQNRFRRTRLEVHDWNEAFWAAHNTAFTKEREAFVAANATPDNPTLDADQMSVFYKNFLDKNWKTHKAYNIEWYKKNISLLLLSVQVFVEKSYLKMKL